MGSHMGVSPKIVVPQNGWFIMEHHIKMDNLGVPLFLETPIWSHVLFWLKYLEKIYIFEEKN